MATNEKALFIDLNRLVMARYAGLEPAEIKAKYFTPADNGHTGPAGAELNAAAVAEGIRSLKDCPLADFLIEPTACGNLISVNPRTWYRVLST